MKMVDGEDCTFVSDWTKVPRSKNNKTLGQCKFYALKGLLHINGKICSLMYQDIYKNYM